MAVLNNAATKSVETTSSDPTLFATEAAAPTPKSLSDAQVVEMGEVEEDMTMEELEAMDTVSYTIDSNFTGGSIRISEAGHYHFDFAEDAPEVTRILVDIDEWQRKGK